MFQTRVRSWRRPSTPAADRCAAAAEALLQTSPPEAPHTLRAVLLSSVKLRLCSQENSAILKKLVKLRAQKSALLGFSTHADFILEMNMAKSAKKVAIFLGEWLLKLLLVLLSQLGLRPACPPEELARKLKPLGEEERATILRLKEEECHRRNLPFTGDLHAWDMRYYMTQVSGGGGRGRSASLLSRPSTSCTSFCSRWRRCTTLWTRTCSRSTSPWRW